jgi:putative phage-type endonuclease
VHLGRKIITPENHEHWLALRSSDVTSTEVSALFNLSPYQTVFELWHRKKNKDIVSIEQTDRMKWGSRLEKTIAEGIAADQGWSVSAFKDYVRLPELMAGSSFDYKIGDDGLLEIKNVSEMVFKNSWSGDDDNLEAPAHIELQVQHQLMVSGMSYAYIGALVGGNSIKLIKREPQPQIISQMQKKIREFWASIERNESPAPNFEKDAEFIKQLYSHAEPGLIVEEPDTQYRDLVFKYRDIGIEIKKKESERAAVKSQLLMMIGEHEKVKGQDWTISAGMVGPCQVAFERKGFRDFRINFKKTKEVENE